MSDLGKVVRSNWFENVTFSNIISNTKNKLHFSQFERIETDPSDTRLELNTDRDHRTHGSRSDKAD